VERRIQHGRHEQRAREHPERFPDTADFAARFHQPQFEDLERRVGRPLPQSYRRLFSDPNFVSRTNVRFTPADATHRTDCIDIQHFVPADTAALEDRWPELNPSCLVFATNEGDDYYLALAEGNDDDAPVYVFYHDGGDHYRVAASLEELLSWRSGPITYDD
jgi:hypothetical protein